MRSGTANPFGKCDQEIMVRIDADTREALSALAYASEMTVAEYVRHCILVNVHGAAAILKARYRELGSNKKGTE